MSTINLTPLAWRVIKRETRIVRGYVVAESHAEALHKAHAQARDEVHAGVVIESAVESVRPLTIQEQADLLATMGRVSAVAGGEE